MMVARHEMPGMCQREARPVRYDRLARRGYDLGRWTKRGATDHTVPYVFIANQFGSVQGANDFGSG
jgi:hypothetical protein